ncbi:MAG: hypothetical protein ABI629_07875 [bacterium]
MAKRTDTPAQSADYERGRAAGIFETINQATSHGKLCMDGDDMRAIAEALGVPVLFIETAQTYERTDLDALTDWWATRRAVA